MSYTNPEGQPQGYPYFFTNKIREALIGEIVAINGYTEHIANSDMQEINKVWQHIVEDEKEHYGRFLNLIRKYDPVEFKQYVTHINDNYMVSPMQAYRPEYDRQIILNNIRQDIKGELEAVVLYEQILYEMPYQDIREVFQIVIAAEKEHTEHLTKLLISFDQDKYNNLE